MALYSDFKYNDGTLYGDGSRLDYSAEPVVATAITYNQVSISYSVPTGNYVLFRIVRNQDGYPETAEDGKIVYATNLEEYPTSSTILDDTLVEGRFAYYRTWLKRSANSYWEPAGDASVLVPFKNTLTSGITTVQSEFNNTTLEFYDKILPTNLHMSTTHERFMSYLPTVLTSTSLSPVDETDANYDPYTEPAKYGAVNNSLISRFFEGFSFTIDEFLTFIRLIIPNSNGESSSKEVLKLKSFELGIKPYNDLSIKSQKRLVRDALTIYGGKGTLNSLKLFVKDLTGYSTTITETANLMLSHEESTFDIENWSTGEPIGSWIPNDGVSLSVTSDLAVETVTDNTNVARSLDSVYSLKVSTTGSDQSISYGANTPVNNAIPVKELLDYTLSFYYQSSGDISVSITWHDYLGRILSTTSGEGSVVATSGSPSLWSRKYFTAEAPINSVYASLKFDFSTSTSSSHYFDMVQFEQSSSITDYVEPRGVLIDLSPSKYNYLSNPSFEAAVSDIPSSWTFTDLTAIQVDSSLNIGPGSDSMVVVTTPSGSGEYLGIVEASYSGDLLTSKLYTFSIYAKSVSDIQDVSLVITDDDTVSTNTVTLTEDWQRVSVSLNCAEVPTSLTVQVTSETNSKDFYLDSAQLEDGYVATDYFDGDRTYDGAAWSGTHQESPSVYYPNKELRLAHLMDSITEYLPISTPYYVTFYDSPTFTEVALTGIS
jgi:hypothetical protein